MTTIVAAYIAGAARVGDGGVPGMWCGCRLGPVVLGLAGGHGREGREPPARAWPGRPGETVRAAGDRAGLVSRRPVPSLSIRTGSQRMERV